MYDYELSWTPETKQLDRPYYKSLFRFLARDIMTGVLEPNVRLPSQRELSYYLDINFTTVTRAYKMAFEQGLLYSIKGKGTFVSPQANVDQTVFHDWVPNRAINLGFVDVFHDQDPQVTRLIHDELNGLQVAKVFSYDRENDALNRAKAGKTWLSLLGITPSPAVKILMMTGAQSALTTIMMGLFARGDAIAVDEYTYSNFIELAKLVGIELVPIPQDRFGMRIDILAEQLVSRRIKGVYVMPFRSNPTNLMMSAGRRHALADLAMAQDLLIIEDDYLRFLKPDAGPALLELAPSKTIGIFSTSKAIAPGIRLGFIACDAQFEQRLHHTFVDLESQVSTIDAIMMTDLILSGKVRKIVKSRVAQIQQANQICDALAIGNTQGLSLHRWLALPDDCQVTVLQQRLRDANILVLFDDHFRVGHDTRHRFIRVSLSATSSLTELRNGLIQLQALIQSSSGK